MTQPSQNYDVVVVGGGPGGYTAAIRAAQLGLTVACVESDHYGGTCLNWGCIPTKALLRTAEVYHNCKNAKAFGLKVEQVEYDTAAVVKRSRRIATRLEKGVEGLLGKSNVDIVRGQARLLSSSTLAVTDKGGSEQHLQSKHIVLATGARPKDLPSIPVDGELVWNYKHAMTPESIPASLLIVGAGAIGVEFASFYADLGSDVTIVEFMDRMLPACDAEISEVAARSFKKRGIKLLTKTAVTGIQPLDSGVNVTLETAGKRDELTAERVISATGVIGNTEGLGLEALGIIVEQGHIKTDVWGETSVPGVWAIGDLNGPPCLAHKASHEGIIAVERIAGKTNLKPLDRSDIPACIYSRPQIASVGLAEGAARSAGNNVKVGRFPLMASGKAIAMGETEGLVKTLFDANTGELLGAHLIGSEVTELIHSFVLARTLETTEAEIMHSIFPHPTLSEAIHESALDAYERAINI